MHPSRPNCSFIEFNGGYVALTHRRRPKLSTANPQSAPIPTQMRAISYEKWVFIISTIVLEHTNNDNGQDRGKPGIPLYCRKKQKAYDNPHGSRGCAVPSLASIGQWSDDRSLHKNSDMGRRGWTHICTICRVCLYWRLFVTFIFQYESGSFKSILWRRQGGDSRSLPDSLAWIGLMQLYHCCPRPANQDPMRKLQFALSSSCSPLRPCW